MNVDASVLVDTNVLVYAHDSEEQIRHARAKALLTTLAGRGSGALSTQMLGELYSVATRRFRNRLSPETAARQIQNFADSWIILPVLPETVLTAVRAAERYGFAYYDAQVWAVAWHARIPYVLTEDFSDGLEIEGVRFVNPFVEGFDIEALLA